jgi:glycosyltransferase involved in cell wall biosynthesis
MSAVPAPRVSVILPTYNRMPYLRQAIESVLAQTAGDWELIVADDGSDDDTRGYLAQLHDDRVRPLRLGHLGHPGKVRNAALPHARGQYVAFLDSDDWWEREKLASQLAAHAEHPDCGWSYTWFRSVDEQGHDLPSTYHPREISGMIVGPLLSGSAIVITPSVMVDRALLQRTGGFDESLAVASHLELFVRLALRSPVLLVPRVLVARRTHADNYGRPFRDSRPDIERVFQRLASHAPTPGTRRMVAARREQWLVDAANRLGAEGRLSAAWGSLGAALPGGAMSVAWWKSAVKTLARVVLPAGKGTESRVQSVDRE